MSNRRKCILELGRRKIQINVFEQSEDDLDLNWCPYTPNKITAVDLCKRLHKIYDFIFNVDFAYGNFGCYVLWDDLQNYTSCLYLDHHEWKRFVCLNNIDLPDSDVNWIKEGF